MRIRILSRALLIVLLAFPMAAMVGAQEVPLRAQDDPAYRPGAVLVRLLPEAGARKPGKARLLAAIPDAAVESQLEGLDILALRVPVGTEEATVQVLRQQPHVLSAELDYRAQATELPNDPGWSRQWNFRRINAPLAWDVTTGVPDQLIAVVDSGITLDHPDLRDKLWTNYGEVPGNGIDDDRNGKIDDVHGWRFRHFFDGSQYVAAEDSDVRDDMGHGTHVAGIAAATANNGTGVAGMSWGSGVLPVKVLDQYGNGWYSDIASGIVYAVDNGARVINLSLGGESPSDLMCAAVDYAFSKGAVLAVATGNTGAPVLYPAACQHILAVAATGTDDSVAAYSNYGIEVDVAAPGTDIYSTWPWLDGYYTKTGTSMATPHVSGLAALIRSRWPAMNSAGVMERIISTAVDRGSPGWDPYTGWGRIDAGAALNATSGATDLWINLAAPALVMAGDHMTYTLTYGNGGDFVAEQAWITVTLPVGVSTSAPTSYYFEQIPVASGAFRATIPATAAEGLKPGTGLLAQVQIIARNTDVDGSDNISTAVTRVGCRVFLPQVRRQDGSAAQ